MALAVLALCLALPARGQYVADEVLRLVPPAAGLTLGALGVPAEHPFRERAAVMATSGILVAGSVYLLKQGVQLDRHTYLGLNTSIGEYVAAVIDETVTIHNDTTIGG